MGHRRTSGSPCRLAQRDALRGREVAWEGGSGVADGIDDRGYLVVVTPAGDRIAVGAGEVHLTSF